MRETRREERRESEKKKREWEQRKEKKNRKKRKRKEREDGAKKSHLFIVPGPWLLFRCAFQLNCSPIDWPWYTMVQWHGKKEKKGTLKYCILMGWDGTYKTFISFQFNCSTKKINLL